jgi:hypothetical protein
LTPFHAILPIMTHPSSVPILSDATRVAPPPAAGPVAVVRREAPALLGQGESPAREI